MLIICKSPERIAGRTKHLYGPHAARVFETPDLNNLIEISDLNLGLKNKTKQ